VLCDELLAIMDQLPTATGRARMKLLSNLDANHRRRKELRCKLCPAPLI
jgi:hypothetical protein